MSEYLKHLNPETKKYFRILCPKIPSFLYKYLEAPELTRLKDIGHFCGMDYCSPHMYHFKYYFSRLDHSIAVSLITWHFTHDKKQAISALLHDITTPVFSHVIDIMNDDAITQEHTEQDIEIIINKSPILIDCLKKDKIKISDITNYKNYSIVDNNRPKVNADRLEGIFSTSLIEGHFIELNEIEDIYRDIMILTNSDNELELGFINLDSASKLLDLSIKVGYLYQENRDKITMKLLGDITKLAIEKSYINENDLYIMREKEIIDIINNIEEKAINRMWDTFKTMENIFNTDDIIENEDIYCITSFESKRKYVDPLVLIDDKIKRISEIRKKFNNKIKEFLAYQESKYVYTEIKKTIG